MSRALLAEHGDADGDYQVGDVVRFPAPDGQASSPASFARSTATRCVFDFNHPLAGRPVTFEVQLIGVL